LPQALRRGVADRPKKPAVIEPVHSFEGGELDSIKRLPRPAAMYDLGFVKSVDSLCKGIVIDVTNTIN